jgi:hypothetical protein
MNNYGFIILTVYSVNKVIIWSCHYCLYSCVKTNPQQQRIHVVTYGVRSGGNNSCYIVSVYYYCYIVRSNWRSVATLLSDVLIHWSQVIEEADTLLSEMVNICYFVGWSGRILKLLHWCCYIDGLDWSQKSSTKLQCYHKWSKNCHIIIVSSFQRFLKWSSTVCQWTTLVYQASTWKY